MIGVETVFHLPTTNISGFLAITTALPIVSAWVALLTAMLIRGLCYGWVPAIVVRDAYLF